ncbi:hypothetical protein PAHAL_3G460500 [Panicum hallii]|uniref:Uncharacterized protein n=1 Tax=Panicum hallii TaxID=206008 RepID=A0A2T8KLI2_9POAL|nr:hypothetical protein PAHAL_3G460500 [Panicum hallii]
MNDGRKVKGIFTSPVLGGCQWPCGGRMGCFRSCIMQGGPGSAVPVAWLIDLDRPQGGRRRDMLCVVLIFDMFIVFKKVGHYSYVGAR